MDTETWKCENLKVGDEVAVLSEFGSVTRIHKVERVTKAQFKAGPRMFWRKNGHVVGAGNFASIYAYPARPEHREEASKQLVKYFLRGAPWASLSPEGQRRVADFIRQVLAEEAKI